MKQLEPVTDEHQVWSFPRRPTGEELTAVIKDNGLEDYSINIQWAYDADNPSGVEVICYLVSFDRIKK